MSISLCQELSWTGQEIAVRCWSSQLKKQAKMEREKSFFFILQWYKQESKTREYSSSSLFYFSHEMVQQSKVWWISTDVGSSHCLGSFRQKALRVLWNLGAWGGMGGKVYSRCPHRPHEEVSTEAFEGNLQEGLRKRDLRAEALWGLSGKAYWSGLNIRPVFNEQLDSSVSIYLDCL